MSDETVRIDDGGSAFPRTKTILNHDIEMQENYPDTYSVGGMSLRDYFAAKAMQAMISKFPAVVVPFDADTEDEDACAHGAYVYADAMIAARKAGGK